jgi:hypothetical protein
MHGAKIRLIKHTKTPEEAGVKLEDGLERERGTNKREKGHRNTCIPETT